MERQFGTTVASIEVFFHKHLQSPTKIHSEHSEECCPGELSLEFAQL